MKAVIGDQVLHGGACVPRAHGMFGQEFLAQGPQQNRSIFTSLDTANHSADNFSIFFGAKGLNMKVPFFRNDFDEDGSMESVVLS